jgi:hypothetical protein
MRRGSIQGAVGGGGATPGDAFGACQRGLAARSQCLIDRGDVEGARAATDVAWLAKLDELALADDTIVIYGTDNGPHANSWPDGATTPFRSEKNTNWEGAFRVPWLVRWPGTIKPGRVSNEIVSHHDWLPTLLAAAGMPDVMDRLKAGYKIGDTTYKVHIDGFNCRA